MNRFIAGTVSLAAVATVAISAPAMAWENRITQGRDAAWTDGPKTIAVQDHECDGNQVEVQHKFSPTGGIHRLRDKDGCSHVGWNRVYGNSGNYFLKYLYSMRLCEMKGKSTVVVKCTHWHKTGFVASV